MCHYEGTDGWPPPVAGRGKGQMTTTETPLRVGDVLQGFCGGWFGRNSYEDKRVEAIGSDWVVVRDDRNYPLFSEGDPERLIEYRGTGGTE